MVFDPSIYMRGAEQRMAVHSGLKEDVTGAFEDYYERKALEEERARKDEALKAKQAMDLDYIRRQAAMGVELAPEQEAALKVDIAQKMSQMTANPVTGELYSKYQPVGADARFAGGVSPIMQTLEQAGAGQLLPPPAQSDFGSMPTPIGEEGVTERDLLQGIDANPAVRQKAKEALVESRIEEQAELRKEKRAKAQEARQFVKNIPSAISKIDSLNKTIDTAIGQTNWMNTGNVKGRLVPSGDLNANLLKVKANEFIDQIIQAKEKGATFGALSEQEGQKLESLRGSLERTQSEEQLDRTLNELKQFNEEYKQRIIRDAQDAVGSGFVSAKQVEFLKKQPAAKQEQGKKRLKFNPATGELE